MTGHKDYLRVARLIYLRENSMRPMQIAPAINGDNRVDPLEKNRPSESKGGGKKKKITQINCNPIKNNFRPKGQQNFCHYYYRDA